MSTTLGIDPGKRGALVLVEGHEVLRQQLIEDLLVAREYSPPTMAGVLRQWQQDVQINFAIIERVQARPGEGVTSSTTAGLGAGIWLGILATLAIPYEVVAPATWTSKVLKGQPGEGKGRSITYVQARLPGLDLTPGRRRAPQDGLADAACLALYGQLRGGL